MADTQEQSKELSVYEKTAGLVETYGKKIVGDQRAGEFWTHMSILKKQEPKIAQCTPDSVITSMLACIRLDLMPNTSEQLAFLIPYWNKDKGVFELSFQIGYKGLKELAYRTGIITMLNGELVFEGDEFDIEYGTNRRLVHKPDRKVNRTDLTKVTDAYITVKLTNGETFFHAMTVAEIERIRIDAKERNFGKDSPAWKKWWDQQALKTVLKRATKQLPTSTKDNRLALAAEWDSLATARKLIHRDDVLIEGESWTREELAEAQRQRMEKAVAERKEMADSGFEPTTVEPIQEEGASEAAA